MAADAGQSDVQHRDPGPEPERLREPTVASWLSRVDNGRLA